MLHWYAPGIWQVYGVPFDRLLGLCWWDVETMARTVDRQEAKREP